jgi:hypothetical protein
VLSRGPDSGRRSWGYEWLGDATTLSLQAPCTVARMTSFVLLLPLCHMQGRELCPRRITAARLADPNGSYTTVNMTHAKRCPFFLRCTSLRVIDRVMETRCFTAQTAAISRPWRQLRS